jgi:alanyl-tRNA synthetase
VYAAPPFRDLSDSLRQELTAARRPPSEHRVRALLDHSRTIALLLGSGVEPGSRRHGHVLRRLIRRCLGILSAGQADLGLLARAVDRAALQNRIHPGFPPDDPSTAPMLDAETERFQARVDAARRRFDRHAARGGIRSDEVFEMHATHGLPWELLKSWLDETGLRPEGPSLDVLREQQRERSRAGGAWT